MTDVISNLKVELSRLKRISNKAAQMDRPTLTNDEVTNCIIAEHTLCLFVSLSGIV
jgi:hypothetical protein